MINVRVMPCLLLKEGKLVKTINFQEPNYIGDPVNAIKIYNDKEVDELVVLDIGATIGHRQPDFQKIEAIATECFMPLAYGGGITTLEEMKRIYSLGVEKIVLGAKAFRDPAFLSRAAALFGSQSVVVSLDVRKNLWGKDEVFIASGTVGTKLEPVEAAKMMAARGAGEIFFNSIERDGTFSGYDLKLIKKIAASIDIPLIVCGGAGSIKDFEKAVKAGASAVAAGSLFVYFRNNREGVLINFPSNEELRKVRTYD